MNDLSVGNIVTLFTDPDERSEHLMDAYTVAAKRHLNDPTPERFIEAREAYARWVRDYVGGAEAEQLIKNFNLGGDLGNDMGMSA